MAKRLGRPPKRVEIVLQKLQQDWVRDRRPGFRLPSENALAKQYKVSRPTIRNVLEQLQRKKLVARKPSAGCFVGRFPRVNSYVFLQKEIGVSFARPTGALNDSFLVSILDGILREVASAEMNLSMCGVEWRWLSGGFRPPPEVAPVRERLIALLADPDERVAAAAAAALGGPNAADAVAPLLATLSSHESARVRLAAIRGLGLIDLPNARDGLERAAQSHPDPATKRRALAELRKAGRTPGSSRPAE